MVAAGLAASFHPTRGVAAQCGSPPRWPPPFGFPDLHATVPANYDGLARACTVAGGNFRFDYRVDGQPTVILGMGYNPQSGELSADQRRERLTRDFSRMREAGVNTVFGWDPVEFDGLTLDVAEEQGLGVAVPYDVDFNADFRQDHIRRQAIGEVLDRVGRYRSHPAVRIWAIGNEVFQRTVPPGWCDAPMAEEDALRARALARFLVQTADAVHALDPLHPVLYREAEESYVSWLAGALQESPASRPWFIYGMNAYTERLTDILQRWPELGLDMPIMASEFALYSAQRGQRGQAFRDLWATVRRHPSFVLGGAVYVWYTDGPEAVDQVYGLVDINGQPVDDALDSIGSLYRAEVPRI